MIFSVVRKFLLEQTVGYSKLKAKELSIKRYSSLNKGSLIQTILEKLAVVRIQRWTRRRIAINDTCPFTLDEINYPCWGKKVQKKFFYCNLEPLGRFLVTSGDFRDPNTRSSYTEKELDQIEDLLKYHKIKLPKSLKSARTNKEFFRRQKCYEEQIDILMERIRYITWLIRERIDDIIVGEETVDNLIIHMDNIYFSDLSNCMRLLECKSKNSLRISIINSKKIIDEIPIDCNIVDKIRRHFYSWLIQEKSRHGMENLEI